MKYPDALRVTVGATALPVTLLDVKDHLRVGSSAEDVLLTGYIEAATNWAENETRRSFLTKTFQVTLDRFPSSQTIDLERSPVGASTAVVIQYTLKGSTAATTFAASKYNVDTQSEPGRIVLKSTSSWPTGTLESAGGVTVTFQAGYGHSTDVPRAIRHAIMLKTGEFYCHREGTVMGSLTNTKAAEALLAGYRIPSVP